MPEPLSHPAPPPGDDSPGGTIVDRAVLAERRARRAELAEEALARRLAAAEHDAATLSQRLDAATAEREELGERLAASERALVAARQGEHAERCRRVEAEEVAEETAAELDAEVADLRARLASAEARAAALEHELAEVRERYADEVEQLEAELSVVQGRADQRVAALEGELRSLRAAAEAAGPGPGVDEVLRAAGELRGHVARLRARAEAAEEALAGARAELARERERRLPPAGGPAPPPDPAAPTADVAAELAALEHELRRLGDVRARRRPPSPGHAPPREEAAAPDASSREGVPSAERLAADLASAADRLRARIQPPEVEEEAAEARAPADQVPAPAPRVAAPVADGRPGPFPARDRATLGARTDWLARAIEGLAEDDPALAARLVVALLPAQALVARRPLVYDVTVHGAGTRRVHLAGGSALVEERPRPGAGGEVDVRLSGGPAALARLAAGGAPRRLTGVHVEGSRRRLRGLLRARREPVLLGDLARAGVTVGLDLLLGALARGVEPGWTAGEEFSIAYSAAGTPAATVLVTAGSPPTLGPPDPAEGTVATVDLSPGAVVPVLAGLPVPAGERAEVHGDAAAVARLHGWLERAQGLPARG